MNWTKQFQWQCLLKRLCVEELLCMNMLRSNEMATVMLYFIDLLLSFYLGYLNLGIAICNFF
jgi:hypothetical protein